MLKDVMYVIPADIHTVRKSFNVLTSHALYKSGVMPESITLEIFAFIQYS